MAGALRGTSSPTRRWTTTTHRMKLEQAPDGCTTFKHKRDECVKVVLTPSPAAA